MPFFARYGFRSRSYIEQHLSVSFDPRSLKGFITARYRASTLTRFARALTRTGKNGGSRPDGHMISALRNQPTWFKGTFTLIGRNGNQIMFQRHKGDNSWRKLKGQKNDVRPFSGRQFLARSATILSRRLLLICEINMASTLIVNA